jgi:ubiquinone/menaquinone biosynthesis C-methylase UbiE
MIRVLRKRAEIDEAENYLCNHKLVRHHDRLKNWDLAFLHQLIAPMPRSARITDLGCSGLAAIKFLNFLKFKNIYGIDLTITSKEKRARTVMMIKSLSLTPPFQLDVGDLTRTQYPDSFFDLATCISVIEHGVDLNAFFSEMRRIIVKNGYLFLTTDYWPEKMEAREDEKPCGLPYIIFSKNEILQLIKLAQTYGFTLYENSDILDPVERNILGDIYRHTFIGLVFQKTTA